jgi:hypothetical protein
MAMSCGKVDEILPDGKFTTANLFPNYAPLGALGTPDYETHVDDYLRKVRPKVLSFDHYPLWVTENPIHDIMFARNLITMRNASIKYNIPFWGFIQAIGWGGAMREPTFNEYRWLCNAHIVFGAKGFSYFLYSNIDSNGGTESFENSMLDWNGKTGLKLNKALRN